MDVRPRVVVTIDELCLHGFAARHKYAIGDAVQRELVELFAGGPHEAQGERELGSIDGGAFQVDRNAKPAAIGAGIASRVHASTRPC